MSHPRSSGSWFTSAGLFRRWLPPCRPKSKARKPRRSRLGLEILETRLAPAVALVVTDPGDTVAVDGVVTLREALQAANTNMTVNEAVHDGSTGPDNIAFDTAGAFATPQIITLLEGELTITDSVTITGPGADALTISGNNASRIFNINNHSDSFIDAEILALTLTGGNADGDGGAIANFENLMVTDTVLSGNLAGDDDSPGNGGGIYNNNGTVTVTGSTLADNSALGGEVNGGGGICNNGGTVTVTRSVLSGNSAVQGGGIANLRGALTVTDSILSGNAAVSGGGILNSIATLMMVTGSTLSNNSAASGGGILNDFSGPATVANSVLSDNSAERYGGGIANANGDMMTVTNSTLSDNSAGLGGGGVFNFNAAIAVTSSTLARNTTDGSGGGVSNYYRGAATVTNSTLSGNTAGDFGGGIYNFDYDADDNDTALTVTSSTLSHNSADLAGGVYNDHGAVTLYNTIVANSFSGGQIVIVNDGDLMGSYNLIEGESPAGLTDTITSDPSLGPLQDNGGPTWTHALLLGSPAVDAGDPLFDGSLFTPPLTTDQRGAPRVEVERIDIGAYELDMTAPTISAPPNVTVATEPGAATATVDPGMPTASDNWGVVSVTGERSDGLPLTDPYSVGVTIITWTARDADGNLAAVTQTITVIYTNGPPVNSTPGPQSTPEDVPLVFSSATGNALAISDPDAGGNPVQVTLAVTNGVLTLTATDGLAFSEGDGAGDAAMTFTGALSAINAALASLTFTPTLDFHGSAEFSITTNDLGNTGSGGPMIDSDTVVINVLSASEQIDDLSDEVDDLVTAGTLNSGQGNSLLSKLDNARAKLQGGMVDAAINQLNAFIYEVNSLVDTGVLTSEEGDDLIAAANVLIGSASTGDG